MNRFAAVPPLVRPLTPSVYVQAFWQTNKFDWAYEIRIAPITIGNEDTVVTTSLAQDLSDEAEYVFLVEVLNN